MDVLNLNVECASKPDISIAHKCTYLLIYEHFLCLSNFILKNSNCMYNKQSKSVTDGCFGWQWRNPVLLLCGMLLAGTWTLQLATLYGCWWLEGSYIGCRAVQWISINYSGTLLCQHSTGQRSKSQQSAVLHSGTCCMSLLKLMCHVYRENAKTWLSWWGRFN
jgi:hypothetical protein